MEVFKDVIGYNGLYQVSNIGNVKSFKRYPQGKLLRGGIDTSGYTKVCLHKDGVQVSKKVHKLTQYAFGLGDGHIDHVNGVRTDNRLENLRVVTLRQNSQNLECHRNGKLVGAIYCKRMVHLKKPWRSIIYLDGKRFHLGYFETELEAHETYMKKLSVHTKNKEGNQ